MARGLNKVLLIGTLGKDPDVRYAQSGAALTSISVATNESWKDKDGNKQERTEWHRVKFFGRLAEIAGEYLKKGAQVYIEGALRTEKYTDKQGVEKYTTDIIASEMQMLGGKREESGERSDEHSGENTTGNSSSGRQGGAPRSRPLPQQQRQSVHQPVAAGGFDQFPDEDDVPFVTSIGIF